MILHRLFLILPLVACLLTPVARLHATHVGEKAGIEKILSGLLSHRLEPVLERYRGQTSPGPGYFEESRAAVREATAELRAYLEVPENRRELLIERDGLTPLARIAGFGLAEMVEVMLTYPEALDGINAPISAAGSVCALVSDAPLQAIWVCGDSHTTGAAAGLLMGYLGFTADASPYKKIRQMLEAAGATPRPDQAKTYWLQSCDPSQARDGYGAQENVSGSRQRIADAPDTLDAILGELETFARSKGWTQP